MQYTLKATKRGCTPEVIAVTQYGTDKGVKAALAYCERIYPEWQGFDSWEAEACRCENNGDYCNACELLRIYTNR